MSKKTVTKFWLDNVKRLVRAQASAPLPGSRVLQRRRASPAAADAWRASNWVESFHSAPPAPGDLVRHLHYGLYLPKHAGAGGERLPLVVMLHGCGQTIDELAQGTRMNRLAERERFAVLYPEQSRHTHAHRCWHWYDASPHAGGGEAAAITSLVRAVAARAPIDPACIYVAGMSAGAGMALLLALREPRLFAALGLHSAPVYGAAHGAVGALQVMQHGARGDPLRLLDAAAEARVTAAVPLPALLLHGDYDDMVAPVNADQLELQLRRLNGLLDADGTEHGTVRQDRSRDGAVRDYGRDGRCLVRAVRVAHLGHAWSGGDPAFSYAAHGPDASVLLWAFFRGWRSDETGAAAAPETAAQFA